MLLQLPASSAKSHRMMDAPDALYENGRHTIVTSGVTAANDADEKKRETIMSFSANRTPEVPTP
ncbi:hypothetical protein [Streptomyces sp. NPDC006368]|uniref:hypothetical protein n=1 Tax=Streptomyces sp. NPDC006368 TaxID=3156760 RepID=UPI0033A18537